MLRFAWLLVVACGSSDRFSSEVLPLFQARCASPTCHGVAAQDAWPDTEGLFVRLDSAGRVADAEMTREQLRERISVLEPAQSSLVRVPLPRWYGGGPHVGGALFTGPGDPALEPVMEWIREEVLGGEDEPLNELESLFGRTVLPELVVRCARDGCHGPDDVAFTAFPVRLVVDPNDPGAARASPRQIRAAYRVARKFVDLVGADPQRSRLVRKALGEADGGIVHRGDRSTFFPEAPAGDPTDSPVLRQWLTWIERERAAAGVDALPVRGVLFVAGPIHARAPYRIASGELGSDLMLAGWPEPGVLRNLSAALHPEGPAEVRDVALSHDATRVIFAMRRGGEANFALYEVSLADGRARAYAVSPEGSLVQPVFGPDGSVIAAWDGHGELGADGPGVAPELVALDTDGNLVRLTYTPAPEVAPGVLASGKTRGMVGFATRREGPSSLEGVLFRFPLCHDDTRHGEPEYHVQFGASLAPRALHVARDLPDGRQIATLLPQPDADDDRGALVIVDRALGPALVAGQTPSVAGYREPVVVLDDEERWRDPGPLPDGRVLVAGREPDGSDALYVVEIEDRLGGPRAGRVEPWFITQGRSLRSPLPVFARPLEDDGHESVIEPAHDRGVLVLRDVAILEALYGRSGPHGARSLREDIVGLRVSAALPVRDPSAMRGLGDSHPAVVLAELALPADRSAYLDVPARVPLRLEFLDARGMEVGVALDRWFYAEGSERVPGGTNLPTYARACAGCHGAASGRAEGAAAPAPDAISSASVTLSTHASRDRRRPLDPLVVGAPQPSDYRSLVEPLLGECAACHDAAHEVPLAGPGAEYPRAYEELFARVDHQRWRALRSPLVELLVGEELEAAGSPPAHPTVTGDALRSWVRWVENGAFYELERRSEVGP